MAIAERYEQETQVSLKAQVEDLRRAIGALNARVASTNPAGEIGGIRRKVLELDQRIGLLERGDLVLPSKPYSD